MKWDDFDTNKNAFHETIRLITDWLFFMESRWSIISNKNKFIEQNLQPLFSGSFRDPKIKDNQIVEPSPALGTFLRYLGLIDDDVNVSKLAKLVAQNKITLQEYSLIILSKQRGWVNGEPVVNALVLLCLYLKENNYCNINKETLEELSRLSSYDLSAKGEKESNRNDLFYNYIKQTGLFTESESNLILHQEAKPIIDFIAENKDTITVNTSTNKGEKYLYYGDLESGIFKLKHKQLPITWNKFYPNLFSIFEDNRNFVLVEEKTLADFIYNCTQYFYDKFTLEVFSKYMSHAGFDNPTKLEKDGYFKLTGMFIESNIEGITERNKDKNRWFTNEFLIDEKQYYLSTQWVDNNEVNRLNLNDYIKLVNICFGPKYIIRKEEKSFKLCRIVDEYQKIWYGAPGTGKSHTIKNIIEKINPENVFRTTFHPDTDYASFVGCYKPTKVKKGNDKILSVNELTSILNRYKYDDKISYPETKFGAEYWESLQLLSNKEIKEILVNCSISDSMSVEVKQGMEAGRYCQKMYQNGTITYEFVPQVFTKAYVQAYKNPNENIFLVIEEINRGNCAQIFGDIFQLLDRKDGVSEYPVKPDQDLENYLKEQLGNLYDENKGMILPDNLYIWATMNTSDQSLFPIDSAFKRRWDWQYVKIKDSGKEWKIKIEGLKIEGENGGELDWWKFLQKINAIICKMTDSEDKQLGYFFCTAKDKTIDAKMFVGKVVFYLWNDVFKNEGFEDQALFGFDKDGKKATLTFPDFYNDDNSVNSSSTIRFIENIMNYEKDTKTSE